MSDLAHWTPRPRPSHRAFGCGRVRLEPLDTARHGPDLWQATHASPALWDFMGYGPFTDAFAFMGWLADQARATDPLSFAVVDPVIGRALGRIALMEIRPAHGVLEIGHIFFGPALQRTPAATAAIRLLLGHAFDELGYRRVEWKCDARNEASRRAAGRFGFHFEGLFRQHMVVKGKNRDTAWFAMCDDDWPAIRAGFDAWLSDANFDDRNRQKSRLRDHIGPEDTGGTKNGRTSQG
jgi:RimJ/RimL family protein N-acetyltransferase